jgi:hypothetical protein
MPQLSDLVEKRKFVKKEYRPWDLSGTGTVDGKEKPIEPVKSEATSIVNISSVSEEKSTIIEQPIIESTIVQVKMGNDTGNVSSNKQVTIEKQPDNIKATRTKQPDNIPVTIREHTDNTINNVIGNAEGLAYLIDSIKKLVGIQKSIFLYVINVCSARSALDTGNILSVDLANAANCSIGSAKTSLIRLVEKHLAVRLQGKASRGGHMVLGITREIQSAAIQAQQALFNPLKIAQTDNITGNATNNMGFYSSSIYKNNITTSLPEEWKKINFELVQHIGFSETQIRQLHDSNTTVPEVVQDAINRFAYSLEHSDKVKAYNEPLNVLMGVLRKGQRWNEPNYVPPKELALRQILEEKRKHKEQFDTMVKELVELEFPQWKKKLTQEEIKKIVPPDVMKTNLSAAIQASLRIYYTEKVLLPRLEVEKSTEDHYV